MSSASAFSGPSACLLHFPEDAEIALRAAQAAGDLVPLVIERHRFPDGELRCACHSASARHCRVNSVAP